MFYEQGSLFALGLGAWTEWIMDEAADGHLLMAWNGRRISLPESCRNKNDITNSKIMVYTKTSKVDCQGEVVMQILQSGVNVSQLP